VLQGGQEAASADSLARLAAMLASAAGLVSTEEALTQEEKRNFCLDAEPAALAAAAAHAQPDGAAAAVAPHQQHAQRAGTLPVLGGIPAMPNPGLLWPQQPAAANGSAAHRQQPVQPLPLPGTAWPAPANGQQQQQQQHFLAVSQHLQHPALPQHQQQGWPFTQQPPQAGVPSVGAAAQPPAMPLPQMQFAAGMLPGQLAGMQAQLAQQQPGGQPQAWATQPAPMPPGVSPALMAQYSQLLAGQQPAATGPKLPGQQQQHANGTG
jgi:hypothetical protein